MVRGRTCNAKKKEGKKAIRGDEYAIITVVSEHSLVSSYSSQIKIEFSSRFRPWVLPQVGLYLDIRASHTLKRVKDSKIFGDQPICSCRKSLLSSLFKHTTLSIRIFSMLNR